MKWRSAILGVIISAVAIGLTLRQVHPQAVWQAFRAANLWLFLPSTALLFLGVVLRAWRWQLLFLPQNQVRLSRVYAATHLSYLINSLLPGRVGELVRGFLVSESEKVSPGRTLGTIFVEKLLDISMLLLMLAILIIWSGVPAWAEQTGTAVPDWAITNAIPIPQGARTAGVVSVAVFGSIALGFVLMSRARTQAVTLVRRWCDPLPLVGRLHPSRLLETALGSADGLSQPYLLAAVGIISVVMWVAGGVMLLLMLAAYHLPVPVSAAFLLLVVTNLSMTIPSAPAYLGVYHAVTVATLALFPAVDRDNAVSFAIATHALGFGGLSLSALYLLWRGHYRLTDLVQRSQQRMGAALAATTAPAGGALDTVPDGQQPASGGESK